MKETAAAVPEAQREAYESCTDGLPTPQVANKSGLNYAKYVAEMEKIVNGQYKCLRDAYDAEMQNDDVEKRQPTFYPPKNGLCGPTGTVDGASEGE
jgi:hypothetical protein